MLQCTNSSAKTTEDTDDVSLLRSYEVLKHKMSAEHSNVLEALPLWPVVLYKLGKITVILVQQQN